MAPDALGAAREALRWVADAAVPADGGVTWPRTRAPGAPCSDDLYEGTAGVLAGLAEARLTGITDFDDLARAAAGRLRHLVATGPAWTGGARPGRINVPGLYDGLAGYAAALSMWASVSGDTGAAQAAKHAVSALAGMASGERPVSAFRDVISGEAGILLAVLAIGDGGAAPAAGAVAGRLAAAAIWADGEPDWYATDDIHYFLPNFSHGAAGIGYALARASAELGRPDLLAIAAQAGHRLVRLGTRPDGTIAVPHSIPQLEMALPVSYGWCHGPTGTLRLFQVLDQLRPEHGWGGKAEACRQAVRASGLPARLFPGFWDNLGQCCGSAGVGEMALDRYQETGDPQWLAWAGTLAADILARSVGDDAGTRWSHTEHRADPPQLEPSVGWMQGAAGIAGFLLRLTRVRADGARAARLSWPDRPDLPRTPE